MIAENIRNIKDKIAQSAIRANREPEEVKLVAVSKRFPAEAINEAFSSGQHLFGENYIQEVQEKRGKIPAGALIHFIGHLQTNKAKIAAETCSMIETVDRLKLGTALNKYLEKLDRTMDILVQVNIGNDPAKSGIDEANTEELLIQLNVLKQLRVCGLMTIPPFETEPENSRPYFRGLCVLSKKMQQRGYFPTMPDPELSMGMSSDFHIAIEEGATIVRVGTAIFGNRPLRRA